MTMYYFYRVYRLPKSISKLKQEILKLSSIHCVFHYQISYDLYNLGCVLAQNKNFGKSVDAFSKSLEVYKENSDSYYIRGLIKHNLGEEEDSKLDYMNAFKNRNICKSNYISQYQAYELYKNINLDNFIFVYHLCNNPIDRLSSKDLQVLYEHATTALKAKNFHDALDIYQSIIYISSKLHFDYHIEVANLNFELAKEYEKYGYVYEALFFANKALETDDKNPYNKDYIAFINKNNSAISLSCA